MDEVPKPIIPVAPSDFAYLAHECPRCWWTKAHGCALPGVAFPAVFGTIDLGMKQAFTVEALRALGLPAKQLVPCGWLNSNIEFDNVILLIRARLDRLVLLDDDTYAIIDYKTTEPKRGVEEQFSDQLHCYDRCIEFPERGEPRQVSRMGLVIWMPHGDGYRLKTIEPDKPVYAAQTGTVSYVDVDLDREEFQHRMEKMAQLLGSEEMPEPSPNCHRCRAIRAMFEFVLERERLGAA